MALVSTGQITLIDITDERPSSFVIQANASKVQVRSASSTTVTYTPDYSQNNVTITPTFYLGNEAKEDLLQQNNSSVVKYQVNGTDVTDIIYSADQSTAPLTTVPYFQYNHRLIVRQNIGNIDGANGRLSIRAYIPGGIITDPQTDVIIQAALESTLDLVMVSNGEKGADGTSVTILGNYATEQALKAAHATGNAGDAYIVDKNLYIWVDSEWKDVGAIKGSDGQPGTSSYMYIQYSQNANGAGMSKVPTSKTAYIGIVVTTEATAPSEPTAYTWSKYMGSDGADAIFAIVTSDSKIIFTDDDATDITLTANLYRGGTVISNDSVSYLWSALPFNNSLNKTTQTMAVKREYIANAATITCTITYNSKTYKDSIVIMDKTDPIYSMIYSTNGNQFTNGNISTILECKVYDGNGEIDAYSTDTQHTYKYNYIWSKYNSDGVLDSSWGTSGQKTGKQLSITTDDVNTKATFTCEVATI